MCSLLETHESTCTPKVTKLKKKTGSKTKKSNFINVAMCMYNMNAFHILLFYSQKSSRDTDTALDIGEPCSDEEEIRTIKSTHTEIVEGRSVSPQCKTPITITSIPKCKTHVRSNPEVRTPTGGNSSVDVEVGQLGAILPWMLKWAHQSGRAKFKTYTQLFILTFSNGLSRGHT